MPQFGHVMDLHGAVQGTVGGVLLFDPQDQWLGNLTCDLRSQRGNTEIFVPLTTSLLLRAVQEGILQTAA